jgi:hypothetical protein
MRLLLIVVLALAAAMGIYLTSQTSANTVLETANEVAAVAQEENVRIVTIRVGNFFFEGPDGKSGTEGKPEVGVAHEAVANPQVILKLKNGEPVRIVFQNESDIVDHEIVSPLFSAPDEERFALRPLQGWEIEFTPNFLTVQDGESLFFDLACHIRHGQETGHFGLGMHALIEIIPAD